jgi:integrase
MNSFNKEFGNLCVGDIKTIDLENYQALRQVQGKADSYIDSEIKTAKTIVIKAFDNDMVGANPLKAFKRCKKLLKKNSDARDRILTSQEYSDLMECLPLHLKRIVSTAYYTGMRKNEILELRWDHVDLVNKFITLTPSDTKDDEKRKIPIPQPLQKILSSVPRAIHYNHVFLYRGKPVSDIRKGLVKACDKVGIAYGRYKKNGFVFHDLRHTFNTNMRKAGVPESVIMKITGHSTREMFDRYNTVDVDDAENASKKLEVFLANVY